VACVGRENGDASYIFYYDIKGIVYPKMKVWHHLAY